MATTSKRIVGQPPLRLNSREELKAYYEEKYRTGGYNEGGYVIHGVDISSMYHRRRLEVATRFLAPAASDIVLDAGCGNGDLAARIAQGAREVHAIDIASNALDKKHDAVPNLRFAAMDLEALHYPNSFFDCAVCIETIEHVLDPERAIRELSRVMKPGGRLSMTYPTINRTWMKRCRLGHKVTISEHLTEWDLSELLRVISLAGLQLRRIEGIAFDFGPLIALKFFGRFFALHLTKASLKIRRFPANSMFVALQLTKP